MSIAIRVHNGVATFFNSVTRRQFQFVSADILLGAATNGSSTLQLKCIPVEANADREFTFEATTAECTAAFDALAEWNELRANETQANATLWDVTDDSSSNKIYTYPKA